MTPKGPKKPNEKNPPRGSIASENTPEMTTILQLIDTAPAAKISAILMEPAYNKADEFIEFIIDNLAANTQKAHLSDKMSALQEEHSEQIVQFSTECRKHAEERQKTLRAQAELARSQAPLTFHQPHPPSVPPAPAAPAASFSIPNAVSAVVAMPIAQISFALEALSKWWYGENPTAVEESTKAKNVAHIEPVGGWHDGRRENKLVLQSSDDKHTPKIVFEATDTGLKASLPNSLEELQKTFPAVLASLKASGNTNVTINSSDKLIAEYMQEEAIKVFGHQNVQLSPAAQAALGEDANSSNKKRPR